MKVNTGHSISVHYKGTLTDGTEFDNSRVRGAPLTFEVGDQRMIKGFSNAVIGMTVGETKSVTLDVEEAYGPRIENAFNPVPREAFGDDFEFIVGGTVQGNGPQGSFLAKIVEVNDDTVVLDMNHPLAGQPLNFEIEVLSLDGATDTSGGTWNPKMKKAELFEFAKSQGFDVNNRTTKKQLIAVLSGQ